MSSLVALARDVSPPIALRRGTKGSRGSLFSSWGWNGSLLQVIEQQTTIGVLKGCVLSM